MDIVSLHLPLLKTRHFKITKAKLAKILIISELVGILAMIWYLRAPLYRKFIAVKPRAYSISSFEADTRYLLSQNDFLMGTVNPHYKVKLIFTAGGFKRTVKASDQGNWVAQLPKSLKHKSYRLTLATFDTNDKLANVESYKVYVQSENIFYQSRVYRYYLRPFLPSSVQAATIKPTPSPSVEKIATASTKPTIAGGGTPSTWSSEFTSWLSNAQSNGLYPICEYNGNIDSTCNEASDLLITNYSTYANICQKTASCFVSTSASTEINSSIDPVLAESLQRGEPIAYAAVASTLEPILNVAPQYHNLTDQLADTTAEVLNPEEQALLDEKDGKTPQFTPYIDLNEVQPSEN